MSGAHGIGLAALIEGLAGVRLVAGDGATAVHAVTHDSRAVAAGTLYVALPGRRTDGARFVTAAMDAGAVAVALPEDAAEAQTAALRARGVAVLALARPRVALAWLSARVWGEPARQLTLVGITGSNGKSTTATLLADIARAAGQREGLIGTHLLRIDGLQRAVEFTTPEAPILNGALHEMVQAGVGVAAMEVSSIGLAEHRVDATPFAAMGFTNLSADHLDYHGDLAAYGAAKARLFTELRAPGVTAILDVEDAFGAELAVRVPGAWRLAVGAAADGGPADVTVLDLVVDAAGWRGRLVTPAGAVDVRSPMVGTYNVRNGAMAGALALAVGLPAEAVAAGLAGAAVRGRMERVGNGSPLVVVDYAHSADALSRVIEALRPLGRGRVWCVFGCGGDRDTTKRGPMGAAAAAADAVVVTNDNPRSEAPALIAAAARAGAVASGKPETSEGPQVGHTWVELDRRRAIVATIAAADDDDIVLLAGKGHEAWQEVAGVRTPFDDAEEARLALAARAGVSP